MRLEAEIDRLYDEIRSLVERSRDEPGLEQSIEAKHQQLRALQEQEADIMDQLALSRLHFQPGEGYAVLEKAAKLLAE